MSRDSFPVPIVVKCAFCGWWVRHIERPKTSEVKCCGQWWPWMEGSKR